MVSQSQSSLTQQHPSRGRQHGSNDPQPSTPQPRWPPGCNKKRRSRQRRALRPWQVWPLLLLRNVLSGGGPAPITDTPSIDSPDIALSTDNLITNPAGQQHQPWAPQGRLHNMQPESDDHQDMEEEPPALKHDPHAELEAVVGDSEAPSQQVAAPHYRSGHSTLQLWLKLWGVTPANLPPDLQQQLKQWLGILPCGLVVYLRPPGVLLSMHLLVPEGRARQLMADGLPRLVHQLLHPGSNPFWRSGSWTAQLGGQLMVVQEGAVAARMDCSPAVAAAGRLPVLQEVDAAVCVQREGEDSITLTASGTNLDGPQMVVAVKAEGKHLAMTSTAAAGAAAAVGMPATAAAGSLNRVELKVAVPASQLGPGPHLVWVEVGSSMYYSTARPVLVVGEAAADLAQEVNAIRGTMDPASFDSFLVDLALVLQYTSGSTVSSLGTGLPREAWATKRTQLAAMADAQGWEEVAKTARAAMQRPEAAPAAAAERILAEQQEAVARAGAGHAGGDAGHQGGRADARRLRPPPLAVPLPPDAPPGDANVHSPGEPPLTRQASSASDMSDACYEPMLAAAAMPSGRLHARASGGSCS